MMGAQVLVVEDDDDIRDSLVEILGDYGYQAEGAPNGRVALRTLRATADLPCVILLDLMMPVMDGPAFREEQLRDRELAQVPVIVLSAYRNLGERAQALGAQGFLPKPFQVEELLRVIGENCGPPKEA